MNGTEPVATTNANPRTLLAFRMAVGIAGVALLVLFALLGSVAMKQSATSQTLESRDSPGEDAPSAPARE